MKVLVLGKGVANDGVVLLLEEEKIEYDYLNVTEVTSLNYKYVIKAPGIPMYNELVMGFIKSGIEVITDIELAMRLRKKFYIGVTGSNGKTTTVSLISHILSSKYRVICCGNIGYSVCKALVENKDVDIFIVEMSSFQLECAKIDLDISVLLNVNPCHMDHHQNFKNYIKAKSNICTNQNKDNTFIYCLDDYNCKYISRLCNSNKVSFSINNLLSKCYAYDNKIYYKDKYVMKINNIKEYLLYDIMASILVCMEFDDINLKLIEKRINTFEEVKYRFTKINEYIYNDAKSTNPYSTIASLKELDNVYLICGGYDRFENLNCLYDYLEKIDVVFAYGETRFKVFEFFNRYNKKCFIFNDLKEAFIEAISLRKQQVILYSPMFASFDQFNNYEERGELFNELCKEYL